MTTESQKQPKFVYESPDKGGTVYARTIGSTERTLVHSKYQPWVSRWSDWQEIMKAAETNPALDDLIKQAEMVYALTK
jgi:hypothetical protein